MSNDVVLDFVGVPAFLSLSAKDMAVGCVGTGTYRQVSAKYSEESLGAVTPTGSVASNAAALPYRTNIITGAPSGKAVVLPTSPRVGRSVFVINRGITNSVNVLPASGGEINSLGANTAYALASASSAEFICASGNTWWTR